MQEIQINTIKDVQDFAQLLYDKYDVTFHPIWKASILLCYQSIKPKVGFKN